MDDSVCNESGMTTKAPHKSNVGQSGGGDQNNQIMVIITQIVYIIVQIVNRMGGTQGSGGSDTHKKHTKATPEPTEVTTPFDWDKFVEQYSTPAPELTNTPDWNDLISQIMSQMGSTVAGGMSLSLNKVSFKYALVHIYLFNILFLHQ